MAMGSPSSSSAGSVLDDVDGGRRRGDGLRVLVFSGAVLTMWVENMLYR